MLLFLNYSSRSRFRSPKEAKKKHEFNLKLKYFFYIFLYFLKIINSLRIKQVRGVEIFSADTKAYVASVSVCKLLLCKSSPGQRTMHTFRAARNWACRGCEMGPRHIWGPSARLYLLELVVFRLWIVHGTQFLQQVTNELCVGLCDVHRCVTKVISLSAAFHSQFK